MDKNETHFGYQSVKTEEKVEKVAEVFRSVAPKYDLMNDLMSLGIHRIWKRIAVHLSYVRTGDQVLDLASGSGDLALLLLKKVGPTGKVVLSDINPAMLQLGKDKLTDKGIVNNVEYAIANAEDLPFADNRFAAITMGFGLRNVTDKQAALNSMYRCLKPGGQVLILEFSKPILPGLDKLYDWYSFNILPKIGKFVAQDEDSYRYLAESIRMHPDQKTLKNMMEQAGFVQCEYHNLSGGIVAIHKGVKA